jgi:hypothetical protein
MSEQCPLCGTELSQTKFAEIQSIIGQQEKKKSAEQKKLIANAESSLRFKLEQQFQSELKTQRDAAVRLAKQESQEEIKKMVAERDQASKKAKEAEAREGEIRSQAARDKEQATKLAKQTAQIEINKMASERDQANKKLKEAEAREASIRKQAQEEAERKNQKDLSEMRAALEKDRDAKLLKQQSAFNRERESIQKKAKLMEQQLQKKTANELGDGAEIDLFDALREAFPGDDIRRVQKGQSGADVLCEVLHKGQSCGRIIIDSKNRLAWQNVFITKLRQDQVNANADHAILASSVFPAGKRELCIESDVIVVHPARVVHVAHILRQTMVAMHVQGLSIKERTGKMARLYSFITSESYSRKFSEAGKLTQEILELDVQEKKAHDNVWKKRGSLATRVNHVLREIETEVSAVVEGNEPEEGMSISGATFSRLGHAKSAV